MKQNERKKILELQTRNLRTISIIDKEGVEGKEETYTQERFPLHLHCTVNETRSVPWTAPRPLLGSER